MAERPCVKMGWRLTWPPTAGGAEQRWGVRADMAAAVDTVGGTFGGSGLPMGVGIGAAEKEGEVSTKALSKGCLTPADASLATPSA
jgi:hypothetical protein